MAENGAGEMHRTKILSRSKCHGKNLDLVHVEEKPTKVLKIKIDIARFAFQTNKSED